MKLKNATAGKGALLGWGTAGSDAAVREKENAKVFNYSGCLGRRDPVSQLVQSPLLLDGKLKAQPTGAIQVKGCHESLTVPFLLTLGLSIHI